MGLADSVSLSCAFRGTNNVPEWGLGCGLWRRTQSPAMQGFSDICKMDLSIRKMLPALRDLSPGAAWKGFFAQFSIKEKFQAPRAVCPQRGTSQLAELGSLALTPHLPS